MEAAAKTANTAKPDQTLEPKEYESKLRKTTCNSFGMGMKVWCQLSIQVLQSVASMYGHGRPASVLCSFKHLKCSAASRQRRGSSLS